MKTRILPTGRSRRRGFTLLETLVVFAIIGAVLAMALPLYAVIAPRLQITSSAQELLADLRHARSEAITDKRTVAVTFRPLQHEYALDGHGHHVPVAMDVALERGEPLHAGGEPVLHFYNDGSGDAAAITLSSGEHHATIRIDWLTGRVRLNDD